MAGAVVPTAASVVATPAVLACEVVATPSVVPWDAAPDVVKRSIVDPTPLGDSESEDDRRTPSTTPAKTTAPTAARTSQVARLLMVLSGFYAFIAQKEQSQRPTRRRGLASSTHSSVRLLLPPVTHGTWAGPHSFSIGTHRIGTYKAAVHSCLQELERLVGRAFRAIRPRRAPLRPRFRADRRQGHRLLRRGATASDHSHLSASVPLAACRSPWRCGARASRASWLPRSGSRTTASAIGQTVER